MPTPGITPLPPASPQQVAWPWPWLAGVGALAVALGGVGLWSRRRGAKAETGEGGSDTVAVAPLTPIVPRGRLALALRPTRAGLNMLSATVDCEVTVTNRGDAPATDIRLRAQLLSASSGQEAAVSGFAAEPIARSAAPTFALAPGEERRLRIVMALPRDAIEALSANGRPMFIPLAALNVIYATGDGGLGQTVQAFAVGVERVDSSKLAPFWLDVPPRMQDAVAARSHAVLLER